MTKHTNLLFLFIFLCFSNLSEGLITFAQLNDYIEKNRKMNCNPQLTGRVVLPESPDYDHARLVSNYYTSKNKFPKVIVYCQNSKDVQNAVKWAICNHAHIRIRSGGHNHEGFSTGNNSIVIDVSEMKNIELDKSKKVAKVQPGVNNKELYTSLFSNDLTHVGGTCSDVALSGLVLSGGMGPLYRRVGLTCDTLISFEMVNAEGDLLYVTKDNEYKDLFWASCGGGGGNFGIITSIVINVYDALPVTWFNIGWDWNQPVDKIIQTWQNFFSKPDKKWFSHLDLWPKVFPSEKLKKLPIKAIGMFWGTPEEARLKLQPLLNVGNPSLQTIKSVTWLEAIKLIEDSTAVFLTDKPEYKSPGAFVMEDLPLSAIQTIEKTLKETDSPLLNVLLFSFGGAASEKPTDATAYYYRKAKFFLNYTVQWLDKDNDKKSIKEIDTLRQQLLAYSLGDYIGNPDPNFKDYLTEYYGKNADKLRCIKRKYDPKNIFHFEQSILPATNLCQ